MLRTSSRTSRILSAFAMVAASLTLSSVNVAASDNKKPLSVSVSAQTGSTPGATPVAKLRSADAMGRVPLAFEANQGQVDQRVQYFSPGAGYTLFLTRDEAVLSLKNAKGQPDVLRIKLNGADAKSKITALERLGWNTNYFIGNDPKKWRTDVPNYRKVQFDNVYPGVSLVYYGNQRQLEHDFVVAPNADTKQIAMEIAGANELTVADNGDLVIKTNRGEVRFEKPIIYQDVNGARKDVAGKFVLRGKKNVGFEIADYDRSKALIIDPVINFGTLLSTSVGVSAAGVAVDGAGNSYVAGVTQATSFPAPAPAPGHAAAPGPSDDAYVVKVSADGSSLGYVSFIGSSGVDFVNGIALDASNNAYITGQASCTVAGTSTDFPTTADAFQQSGSCPGTDVAYVTKLNPTGSALLYSTLFGGDGVTHGIAIATSGAQAFITGTTASSATPLPLSGNAFQSALAGSQDAFLAQIDTGNQTIGTSETCVAAGNTVTIDFGAAPIFAKGERIRISGSVPADFNAQETITSVVGTTVTYVDAVNCTANHSSTVNGTVTGGLVYGSYLGGTVGASVGNALAVGALNSVFVGGVTTSATFPTVLGAQLASGGGSDGFITKFDPTNAVAANTVPASTYVGGSASDQVNALALDGSGNLYAAGFTASTNFPNTAGGAQAVHGADAGGNDGFVTKLPTSLASFTQSTYLGGTGNDQALAISINGNVWVVGQTTTPTADGIFNTNALDGALSGTQDGFIARFSANLSSKQVATYFGGNGNADSVTALVATGADTVVVAGQTDSTDFYALGATTGSAYQAVPASANKAGFLAKFSANNTVLVSPLAIATVPAPADPLGFNGTNTSNYTVTLTNNNAASATTNTTLDLHMDLAKLVVNTITPSAGACSPIVANLQANANSGITCSLGTLAAAGGTANVVVNVQGAACAGVCPATTATTSVRAGSAESGSNATTTITSNIVPDADIVVSTPTAVSNLSGAGKFVVQKDTSFTYSYTATNSGPDTSGTFTLTNALPTGFTVTTPLASQISVTTGTATSASCAAQAGTTITCTVTGLSSLGVVTVTLAGDPTSLLAAANARTTNQLDFTATMAVSAASFIDSTPGNDTGSVTGSALERVATFSSSVAATAAGSDTAEQKVGTLSWTATATNNGPSTVASMRVVVTVDRGAAPNFTNIASVTPGCAAAVGQTITCTDPNPVASGGTYVVVVTATAPAIINGDAAPATQTFTNGAGGVVLTATADTNPATVVSDDTGTAQVQASGAFQATVERRSDLSVSALTATAGPTALSGNISLDLTAGSSNVNYTVPGTTVVYTLTPANPATSFTSGGAVTGATTGAVCVNTVPAPAPALTITCTITNLANAGQAIHLVIGTPTTDNIKFGTVSTATFTSKACISGPVTAASDPGNGCGVGSNNLSTTAGADPSSQVQRQADLDITTVPFSQNAATPNNRALSALTDYNVIVKNNGPDTAINVVAKIAITPLTVSQLVSNISSLTAGVSCVQDANTFDVDCTIASIPPGGSVDPAPQFTLPIMNSVASGASPQANVTLNAALGAQVSTFDTTAGNNSNATTVTSVEQRTSDVDIKTPPFIANRSASVLPNTPGVPSGTTVSTNLTSPMSLQFGLINHGPDVALNANALLTNVVSGSFDIAPSSGGAVRSANVVTITTNAPHGFTAGQTVTVSGVDPVGSATIAAAGANGAKRSSNVVTITTTAPHGFTTGQLVKIRNVTDPTFRGSFTITVTGATTFTYSQSGIDAISGGGTAGVSFNGSFTIVSTPTPTTLTYAQTAPNDGGGGGNASSPSGVATPISGISSVATSSTAGVIPSNCSLTSGNLACTVNNLPTTGTTTVVVTFTPQVPDAMTLAGGANESSIVSTTAAVTAPASYVDATGTDKANASTVTTNLLRQSDLQLNFAGNIFTGTPANVSLAGPLTFTANVNNAGPDPALKAKSILTFTTGAVTTPFSFVAAGSTYDIGGGPTPLPASATNGCTPFSANQLACEVDGPLPVGTSPGFVINITPPLTTAMNGGAATDAMTTSAVISSTGVFDDGSNGNPGANNTSPISVATTIERQADIQVTGLTVVSDVTGGPLFILGVDNNLTYTVSVANNGGPDSATNLDVTAAVPAGFTLTGPVGCSQAGGPGTSVTCSNAIPGPLAAAGTATFFFTGTPASPGTSVPEITAAMSVSVDSAAVIDPNHANNSLNVNATIRRKADVGITSITAQGNNSGASNKFVDTVDTAINYTVNLANPSGPSTATDINISVAVPAGVSLSSGVGCTQSGGPGATVSCALAVASIASPGTASFNFALAPSALGAGTGSQGIVVQVTATGGYIDPNGLNNTNISSPTVSQERDADVSITSVNAVGNVAGLSAKFIETVDTQMNYTVNLANAAGNSTATNINISVNVPAGAALVPQAGCAQVGNVITCNGPAVASIASPGVGSFAFSVTPAPLSTSAASSSFAISVTASGAYTDPVPANNTNFANSISQERDADVSITSITAIGNSAGAVANKFFETVDTQLKYTVNLANSAAANTSTATNINIATTVAAGATLVPQAGCSQSGAIVTCANAVSSLASGAPASFTFAVTPSPLAPSVPSQSLNATATATGAYNDSVPANNTNIAAPAVSQERDADISMTTAGITATGNVEGTPGKFIENVDTNLVYTVNVSNSSAAGTSTATDINFSITSLPAGATLVAQAGCTQAGGPGATITCTNMIPSITAGSSATFTFALSLAPMAAGTASQPLNLNVTATGAFNDSTPANNTNIPASTITEERDADVSISGIASSGNVLALAGKFVETVDSTINYTVGLANSNDVNTSTATNLTLAVSGFPVGASLVPQAGCTQPGGPGTAITCTNIVPAGMVKGATANFSFAVTPAALAANQTSQAFNPTFTVTGSYNDPNSANNTAIPNALSQERDADVAIGAITAAGNVSGLANKFIDTQDSSVVYTVPLSNSSAAGISTATNLAVKVAVPPGASLVAQAGCSQAGGPGNSITCALPSLARGAATVFQVSVAPQALAAGTASTSFNVAFSASGSYVDPTSADDTNIPAPAVSQERDSDLGVTLALDPAQVQPVIIGPSFNQTITYVATVSNTAIPGTADSTATNVQVKDILPTGLVFDAAATTAANGSAACSFSAGAVVCNFGSVAVGATPALKIVLDAGPTTLTVSAASGVVPNLVTVSSSSVIDPNGANNQSTIVNTNLIGEADVSVRNTAMTASPNPVLVGDNVTYTVTVDNIAGPHPSQSLKFNDTLPTGVSFVSVSSPSFTCPGAVLPCTLSSLAAGASTTITVVGHIDPAAVPPATPGHALALTNAATISSNGGTLEDPVLANNSTTVNHTADAAADLATTQTSPAPVIFGNPVTFAVTVSNNKAPLPVRSSASGVVVTSTVTVTPAASAATITGLTPGCSFSPFASGVSTVTCNVAGGLATNTSTTVNFTVTPNLIGRVTNTPTVDPRTFPSVEVDPNSANDSAPTTTVVVDNTPVCSGAGCSAITPVDPATGLSPLAAPQAATVQFSTVTTQGSTTLTVAPQPATCQVLDPTTLPAGSTLINNSTHVPFHGIVPYVGSRTYACGSGAPLFYNIATTATASGTTNVCVNYTGTSFHKADRVRLVQLVSGGGAQDVTIASGFSATTICGQLANFSSASGTVTLAVMEPSNTMPDLTAATATPNNSAAARGAAGNAVDLSAAGTFDNDGPDKCTTGTCSDTLTYRWFSNGFLGVNTVSGKTVTVPVSATGTVNILLTATDPYGDSETRLFTLTFTGTLGSGTGSTSGGFVTSATVNKGQAASFTTALDNPTGSAITLLIANASTLASSQIVCSISPNTLPANSTGTAVTVLCSTQGQVFAKLSAPQRGLGKDELPLLAGMMGLTALPLLGMLMMPGRSRRRRLLKMWAAIGLVLMFTMFQAACGGGGGGSSFGGAPTLQNAGTPAGTYQVVIGSTPAGVTGSSAITTGTVAGSTTFTLTVQ